MKDQYFGDIGDYGKYLLLRHLANSGVRIGINWYLTRGDNTNDGGMIGYLDNKENELRHLDANLFDSLKEMVLINNQRDVVASEKSSLIDRAIYYHQLLDISGFKNSDEKKSFRISWHENALKELSDAELIYFDPDNGISDHAVSGKKDSVKYMLTSEAADYYRAGHNLIYYCHKGRRKDGAWDEYKRILKEGSAGNHLADAKLICITYHRGVQRSFIFAVHPEDYDRYRSYIDSFMTDAIRLHYSEEVA